MSPTNRTCAPNQEPLEPRLKAIACDPLQEVENIPERSELHSLNPPLQ